MAVINGTANKKKIGRCCICVLFQSGKVNLTVFCCSRLPAWLFFWSALFSLFCHVELKNVELRSRPHGRDSSSSALYLLCTLWHTCARAHTRTLNCSFSFLHAFANSLDYSGSFFFLSLCGCCHGFIDAGWMFTSIDKYRYREYNVCVCVRVCSWGFLHVAGEVKLHFSNLRETERFLDSHWPWDDKRIRKRRKKQKEWEENKSREWCVMEEKRGKGRFNRSTSRDGEREGEGKSLSKFQKTVQRFFLNLRDR